MPFGLLDVVVNVEGDMDVEAGVTWRLGPLGGPTTVRSRHGCPDRLIG